MKIFPAIDIKDGKCVRLTRGDFDKLKIYNEDPIEQIQDFLKNGFKNIHIVDLDGALSGKLVNLKIIKKISLKSEVNLQVGGGIRNLESIKQLIDIGVEKVILGTAGIKDKLFLKNACRQFPNNIALAIDVRNKKIALSGWKDQTNTDALEFIKTIEDYGVSRLIYTDINRDGTNLGANIQESLSIAKKITIPLIISGGVSSIEDVKNIINYKEKNIEGIIVGKAIYEKKINLKELKELE
jgi:phosphoribosylformimino-5-aminoimidazole carboxamide ribotide isomerase|tara:strand:+ start:261 stop:980 length:720 start_codon:yes stop_codon:yes gene_type:complete